MPTQSKGFKVRDFRKKGFFFLDDQYLNGYAKHFDTATTAVYLSLCRHADKEQSCFPAQKLIAKEHNLHPRTVRRKITLLEECGLIKKKRVRSKKGTWLFNKYFLLDRENWKIPTIGHQSPMANHRTPVSSTTGHPCPLKDTHDKDTHKR